MSTPNAAREEIQRFSNLAEAWWDPDGPLGILHKLHPTRMAYIREQIVAWRCLKGDEGAPCTGLRMLDVGCGGGIIAESLARLGGDVTGIDASLEGIQAAQSHAQAMGLSLCYRHGVIDDMVREGKSYDVITALEVVEHIPDVGAFIHDLGKLLAPNGLLIMATVNKTAKSFMMGIVAAEYILQWVPRGTHDWRRFIRPSTMARFIHNAGADVIDISGITYNPITDCFTCHQGAKVDVNYMMTAVKRP